jgi:hypothetical protein
MKPYSHFPSTSSNMYPLSLEFISKTHLIYFGGIEENTIEIAFRNFNDITL